MVTTLQPQSQMPDLLQMQTPTLPEPQYENAAPKISEQFSMWDKLTMEILDAVPGAIKNGVSMAASVAVAAPAAATEFVKDSWSSIQSTVSAAITPGKTSSNDVSVGQSRTLTPDNNTLAQGKNPEVSPHNVDMHEMGHFQAPQTPINASLAMARSTGGPSFS